MKRLIVSIILAFVLGTVYGQAPHDVCPPVIFPDTYGIKENKPVIKSYQTIKQAFYEVQVMVKENEPTGLDGGLYYRPTCVMSMDGDCIKVVYYVFVAKFFFVYNEALKEAKKWQRKGYKGAFPKRTGTTFR